MSPERVRIPFSKAAKISIFFCLSALALVLLLTTAFLRNNASATADTVQSSVTSKPSAEESAHEIELEQNRELIHAAKAKTVSEASPAQSEQR